MQHPPQAVAGVSGIERPDTVEQEFRILILQSAPEDRVTRQHRHNRFDRRDGHLRARSELPPERADLRQSVFIELIRQARVGHITQHKTQPLSGQRHNQVANAITLRQARRKRPEPPAQ